MKLIWQLAALTLAGSVPAAGGLEEFFDRAEEALSWYGDNGFTGRLSGVLDLEAYDLQLPAPGVIHASKRTLFTPRLALFLDAQFGPSVYSFSQVRIDRGFDPSTGDFRVRVDEYAVRWSPWADGRLTLQAGKFATVVGNWAPRHVSWTNPFITAPLAYENLTGVWDTEAIRASNVLLQWSHVRPGLPAAITAVEKSLRVPILWGPAYSMGAAVSGAVGKFRYAVDVKQGALASRPEAWNHGGEHWEHPAVGARVGYRPNPTWDFGFSASQGVYLRPFAAASVPAGRRFGDYRQVVVGHDVAFAWHHWQIWGEIFVARFEIPGVADAATLAWYVEAKYKLSPRFFASLRWNEQRFDTIPDRGGFTCWGHDVWRIDFAPGFRLTPHLQLKLQYSLQRGDSGSRDYTRTLASQFTMRF